MNKIYMAALAALGTALAANAQTVIDFESNQGIAGLGVYDTWADSPFRTGELPGNYAVTDNPMTEVNEITGVVSNPSEKVLGAQRSRFGSNTFGVRVDLAEPFEFADRQQYVHVNILRPVEGRVMLIGLGRRRDWADQPQDVEQFWVMSQNTVTPNEWVDAVFPIHGAGGIDIHSLVIVPECESPNRRTDDFLFYVDNLQVTTSSAPTILPSEYYPVNGGSKDDIAMSRNDRYTNSIKINDVTVAINQSSTHKLYAMAEEPAFLVAGENAKVTVNYNPGTWMHSYVYFDRNGDGHFDYSLAESGVPAEGSELVSFSYFNGKNSKGASAGASNSIQPPTFKVPEDLEPGVYRMRVKVDWDCVDPGGNTAEGNLIASNGGVIADVPIVVLASGAKAVVNDNQLNGEVLAEDGTKLNALEVPAREPFTIRMNPEHGFGHGGCDVYYGFNLSGDKTDKYGNPQWFTRGFTFYDETYTLPAEVMFGNVRVEGRMIEEAQISPARGYELNFDPELKITRTDRHLNTMNFETTSGGSLELTFPTTPTTVYHDKCLEGALDVKPEDQVTLTVDYTGNAMHSYIYVDWNRDRSFDATLNEDGTPAAELLSYTVYNGKNSRGESTSNSQVPSTINGFPFSVPADIENGEYVGRYKIDWNNADPKGQWSVDGGNKINDNGGYVVDFLINVTGGKDSISEITVSEAPEAIYDLLGRRLARPAHGLNIISGRKVLVK